MFFRDAAAGAGSAVGAGVGVGGVGGGGGGGTVAARWRRWLSPLRVSDKPTLTSHNRCRRPTRFASTMGARALHDSRS